MNTKRVKTQALSIHALPQEIWKSILCLLPAVDVVGVSLLSKGFHYLISNVSDDIWKQAYQNEGWKNVEICKSKKENWKLKCLRRIHYKKNCLDTIEFTSKTHNSFYDFQAETTIPIEVSIHTFTLYIMEEIHEPKWGEDDMTYLLSSKFFVLFADQSDRHCIKGQITCRYLKIH